MEHVPNEPVPGDGQQNHGRPDGEPIDGRPAVVANEFADVTVRRVMTRNGVRLEISSPRTGSSVQLDALELEALSRQPKELFSSLLEGTTQDTEKR